MAYSEKLAARVRRTLSGRSDVEEKKMFGGLAFMVAGNMCCGIMKEDLVLRLGPERGAKALEKPHTRPFDFTGKPMRGMVAAEGIKSAGALRRWLGRAVDFAGSLPPK